LSGRYQPEAWARAAINAYKLHGADRIVAEVNNGGDLVESTLRMVDSNVAYSAVHASKGKFTRAEPVSALYEQNRVHHCGAFPQLEDQMVGFTPDMNRGRMGSPDRVDALVWALTDLVVERAPWAGLFEYYDALRAPYANETPIPGPNTAPAPLAEEPVFPIYGDPGRVAIALPGPNNAVTYASQDQLPSNPSIRDDPAAVGRAPVDDPPMMVPTRRPGGGIRWIPVS
jgi:hypothetical protein